MSAASSQLHTLTTKNWMQYPMSHVANTGLLLSKNGNLRASNFSCGSMPPDPPSLACFCMHTYMHIRHSCNPTSENPGYGAVYSLYLIDIGIPLELSFHALFKNKSSCCDKKFSPPLRHCYSMHCSVI